MAEPRRLSISWSQIRAHEECKQRSHLLRTGHRNPAQNLRGFYHGMVVDAAMRQWLAHPQHPAGAMAAMVDEQMDAVAQDAVQSGDGILRWKSAHDRDDVRTFCLDLVERLEPILRELILPHEHDVALRFRVPVQLPYLDTGTTATIDLVGEMDLLARPPGQFIVWDLKGTKDDSYWRKVLGQLYFYDLAVYAIHRQPTALTGLIQPMCKKPVVEVHVTDDDRRAMWSRILRYVTDIWNQDAACTTDTRNCPYCEVRHACPRFQPEPATSAFSDALRAAAHELGEAA